MEPSFSYFGDLIAFAKDKVGLEEEPKTTADQTNMQTRESQSS